MDVAPLSGKALRLCLWAICSIGILLNVLVFRKYHSYKCRSNSSSASSISSVRSSLQLLCVLAVADTISLMALMLALGSHHLTSSNSSTIVIAAVCKLDTFLIHASSAFCIWCWLVLSGLRYLAIFHPYTHLRLHREPMLILIFVAIGCCLFEVWILFDVTYLEAEHTCGETLPDKLGKTLQLVEISCTYFVPLSLIIVLDMKVLCRHSNQLKRRIEVARIALPHSATSDSGGFLDTMSDNGRVPSLSAASSADDRPSPREFFRSTHSRAITVLLCRHTRGRKRVRHLQILKRCMCILIIDLVMNLPNHLYRLYLSLASNESLEIMSQNNTFQWLQDLSQLLYFSQFSMNAICLMAINYVLPAQKPMRRDGAVANPMMAFRAQQQLRDNFVVTIPRNYNRC